MAHKLLTAVPAMHWPVAVTVLLSSKQLLLSDCVLQYVVVIIRHDNIIIRPVSRD